MKRARCFEIAEAAFKKLQALLPEIFGFDVVEVDGQKFLVTAEFDTRCRCMGIADMKVSAISLKTLQVTRQEFIKAHIQLN